MGNAEIGAVVIPEGLDAAGVIGQPDLSEQAGQYASDQGTGAVPAEVQARQRPSVIRHPITRIRQRLLYNQRQRALEEPILRLDADSSSSTMLVAFGGIDNRLG